ncbi:hypothetical protein B9Z19DRAFT_1120486 [Tuber borchii]|uniref:Uncharacterized protein n=1 Tax=Tuber borchii TaxID=42251 RepID=A0A2T7A4H2_TUBBO|nr:hypothetical protein B9Z19DRAFT_1120486 [Tuber borchii]
MADVWVYLSVLIAVLCIIADTYTAIILLIFNRWSSQIKPIIPFNVAKIIFAVCVGLSYTLYVIEWWHVARVIFRGGVADAYMDSIALRWHSIRGGRGKEDTGWKRFLVFAKLTEKRGRRDYVAPFRYFSFKEWWSIPLTLVSVIRADLIPDHEVEALSAIGRFFENVGHLYDHNQVQALILGTMTFTSIFWLFTIIQLTIACIMYHCYLIRVIEESSLKDYCRKRVDSRMTKIVLENHRQGLRKVDLGQPTLPAILQQNAIMGNTRNSFTKVTTLHCQPMIPDLWRGQSSNRLNRAETVATFASSMYARSPTMPPPHVDPYTHYPPLRPQHSTHSSYYTSSVAALTSAPVENSYSDPAYPSPTYHSPRGRSPILPRDQQQSALGY